MQDKRLQQYIERGITTLILGYSRIKMSVIEQGDKIYFANNTNWYNFTSS